MNSFQTSYHFTRTLYKASVDDTTGWAISFNKPVSAILIKSSGDYTLTGNSQSTDTEAAAAPLSGLDGWMPVPVGDPQGDSRTLVTIKAASGTTVNVSVLGLY